MNAGENIAHCWEYDDGEGKGTMAPVSPKSGQVGGERRCQA